MYFSNKNRVSLEQSKTKQGGIVVIVDVNKHVT